MNSLFILIKNTTRRLLAYKVRFFLTMLGIIIGIAAVILVISVGAGAQGLVINQIKGIGTNLIGILPGASEENGPPAAARGIIVTTLTNDDIKALTNKKNVSHLTAASAYVRGVATASWANQEISANFVGVNSSYPIVEDSTLALGRFYTTEEEEGGEKVAVLGNRVWQDLFNNQDPIGQKIKIKRETFRVIGVLDSRGIVGFQNPDSQIFIPLTTAQQFLLGIKHVSMARVKIDDSDNIDQAMAEIKATLRERHHITDPINDDFSVRNTVQAIQVLTKVTDSLKYFLTAISALALVVGGIGIMNIMLITVTERVREIGLRKAVGAQKKDIVWQFLIESIIVTFLGGLIGIILGILFSFIIAKVMVYLGYDWDFIVTFKSIIVALSASGSIGLIFGLYPAFKAAKLNPIEALRYE